MSCKYSQPNTPNTTTHSRRNQIVAKQPNTKQAKTHHNQILATQPNNSNTQTCLLLPWWLGTYVGYSSGWLFAACFKLQCVWWQIDEDVLSNVCDVWCSLKLQCIDLSEPPYHPCNCDLGSSMLASNNMQTTMASVLFQFCMVFYIFREVELSNLTWFCLQAFPFVCLTCHRQWAMVFTIHLIEMMWSHSNAV